MKHKRPVVRLTVVDLEHVCPHGRGFAPNNTRKLSDCYMDSATPGHPCSHPVLPDQRCPQVAEARKRTGWRSYKMVPMEYGEAGPQYVGARLIYTPLNLEGTAWMAVNIHTGEKKEVDLTASVFDPAKTGSALITRHYSTHGEWLNEPLASHSNWNGEKPRKRDDCPSCQHSREPGGCYWHRSGLPYPGTLSSRRTEGAPMVKKSDMDSGTRGDAPGRVVERSPASVYFPGNKPGAAPGKPAKKAPTGTSEALANAQSAYNKACEHQAKVRKADKVTSTAELISDEMKKRKR